MALSCEEKLSVDHPDYRYPPSKNPYWHKLQALESRAYLDHASERWAGRWKEHYRQLASQPPGRTAEKLVVEIGCNAGHVLLEWAKKNPNHLYLGIDWKFKPIFRAVEKAARREIYNIGFLRAHAERLPFIFGPEEIDELYLLFPDPWPKKAHQKNRFFSAKRLQAIHPLVRRNGIFHIRTDHPGYFEAMMAAAQEVPKLWQIEDLGRDIYRNHPHPKSLTLPEVTLFERLFIADELPIQRLILRRK